MTTALLQYLTLANGYTCPDGRIIDMNMAYYHIQDFSSSFESVKDTIVTALSGVAVQLAEEINVDSEGKYDGSRLTFNFIRAVDKDLVCTNQGYPCPCHDIKFKDLTFDELNCHGPDSCQAWDNALNGSIYRKNHARPDLLDAAIDVSDLAFNQDVFDSNGRMNFRIISIGTDQCLRESGRSVVDEDMRNKYWTRVPESTKERWLKNSGYRPDGSVEEHDCEIRDYPTVDEFMSN